MEPEDFLVLQLISIWQRSLPQKQMAALEGGFYGIILHWGPSPSLTSLLKFPGIFQPGAGNHTFADGWDTGQTKVDMFKVGADPEQSIIII